MTDSTSPSARTHSRTVLFLIFLIPCVIILAVGGYWMFLRMDLRGRLASLRDKGIPTSVQELNVYHTIPQGKPNTTEAWQKAILATQMALASPAANSLPIIGTSTSPIPPPGEEWSQLDESRQFLLHHPEKLKAIEDAINPPGYVRFPEDYHAGLETVLDEIKSIRNAARLLELDAYVQAHDGNHQKALQDLRGIFLASEVLRYEPLIISQLVRYGLLVQGGRVLELILPSSHWKDEELKSLRDLIASFDNQSGLQRVVDGELALILDHMDRTYPEPLRLVYKLAVLDRDVIVREHLEKPWPNYHEMAKRSADRVQSRLVNRLAPAILYYYFTSTDAIELWMDAKTRVIARQRSMIALIDAQRFRLREGRLPASLEELDAAFPLENSENADFRTDPYDGKPLKLIANDNGIIIYSIGEDGADDAGQVQGEKPKDIGYTLPR